ncbi:hypothetical protein RCOM_1189860 [Ricinus communis]|uniref:Uncharacterized protein n=1 Tax=Ricinus communis TaxID=3988 RepID=B9RRF5_RICCO|nr:hypothetical protein RCOM_1189860 [Ricinus communis]|eukprot:XP_002516324.1 uncharacterized protein LOC8281227 [Ricinus communis]
MESDGEVLVFIDTNIGTHIAASVSPDITAADFKRELEREHLSFFPTLGEIKAHVLMVRRKSCFYHLTESLPIKYAFQGLKGTWFLHVKVQPSSNVDKPGSSHDVAARSDNHFSDGSIVTPSATNTKKNNKHKYKQKIRDLLCVRPPANEFWKTASISYNGKKNKSVIQFIENRLDDIKESLNLNEEDAGVAADESVVFQMSRNKVRPVIGSSILLAETPQERSEEVGIVDINGNLSELNSESKCCDPRSSKITSVAIEGELEKRPRGRRGDIYSAAQAYSIAQFSTITPPRTMHASCSTDNPGSSGNKLERTAAVGRRILIAADNLRLSENRQSPIISFCRFRDSPSMSSISRMSMFEISDNDD